MRWIGIVIDSKFSVVGDLHVIYNINGDKNRR